MKHLIKQHSHFFGEIVRHIKVFPKSLNCFYQSNELTLLEEFFDSPFKASPETSGLAFLFTTNLNSI